jgi:hypothetical protein
LELPIRAGEAAALAETIFTLSEDRPLRDDIRNRVAARVSGQRFETLRPFPGSLARDPVHDAAYFIAIDAIAPGQATPLLLRLASASAPASAVFPNAMLIARTHSGQRREYVINAVPFGPSNHAEVLRFAEDVDRAFLPRPLGAQPSIAIATREPETELPAAFQAYRQALKTHGQNLAAVLCADSDPEHLFVAALWAAIRTGWREGFSAVLLVSLDEGIGAAKRRIEHGSMYSKFILDGDPDPEVASGIRGFIAQLKLTQQPKAFDFEAGASRLRTVTQAASIAEAVAAMRG